MKKIINNHSSPKFHLNEVLFELFSNDKFGVFPWISFKILKYFIYSHRDMISMQNGDLELILKDNIYFDFRYLDNDRNNMNNSIFKKNENRVFYKSKQLIYLIDFDEFFRMNTNFFCDFCEYHKSKICNKEFNIICDQINLGDLI